MSDIDLRTSYLGLELKNPIVAAASPLSSRLDTLQELEQAGVAAVVMQSLFEEQIEHETVEMFRLLDFGTESFGEALDYFPELESYNTGPQSYLDHLEAAKKKLSIPVIASLNGSSIGGWVRFARLTEEAGADALELNIYFVAAEPDETGLEVEDRYLELIAAVCEAVRIPVAVKVGPFFSSMANMAKRMTHAGAKGLVLFNRFVHPDIDLEKLVVVPDLELSTRHEMRLALRWIAILRSRIKASLAATTGIHLPEDVIKFLLAGADVTMMASALLRNGPRHVTRVLEGVESWLRESESESVEQIKGSLSQVNSPDPGAFERTQYMRALVSYTKAFTGYMPPE